MSLSLSSPPLLLFEHLGLHFAKNYFVDNEKIKAGTNNTKLAMFRTTSSAAAAPQCRPCHQYITCSFEHGELGFVAAPFDPAKHVFLANVICTSVTANGQADRAGVCAFDALVSINDEYVAFATAAQCLAKLATAAYSRPLTLTFARPIKTEWTRIGDNSRAEEIIKCGMLEKQGRVFRRSREFQLTRVALAYSDEYSTSSGGTMKKRIPIEEITRVFPSESNKLEFTFVYQQYDTVLRASSAVECMQWLHAIETTKRGCFEDVAVSLSRMQKAETPAPVLPRVAPPAPKPKQMVVPTSPYHLLNKSKLTMTTHGSNGTVNITTTFQLPAKIRLPRFDAVDLTLENKVLSKQ